MYIKDALPDRFDMRIVTKLRFTVPSASIADIVELIIRINYGLHIGCFKVRCVLPSVIAVQLKPRFSRLL